MPIPWSITAISTRSSSPRAVMVTRGAGLPSSASGEYATAFSARLATAVISWLSLPYTVSPRIPTKPTSSPLAEAGVRVRSITSATIRSTETGAGSGSGSPPCNPVRSSSSLTSPPRRGGPCLGLPGQGTDDGVRDGCPPDGGTGAQQPHLLGGRVGQHRPVLPVQDEDPDAQCVEAAPAQPFGPGAPVGLDGVGIVTAPHQELHRQMVGRLLTFGFRCAGHIRHP